MRIGWCGVKASPKVWHHLIAWVQESDCLHRQTHMHNQSTYLIQQVYKYTQTQTLLRNSGVRQNQQWSAHAWRMSVSYMHVTVRACIHACMTSVRACIPKAYVCTLFANAADSQLWLFACFGNCKLVVVVLTLVYCCWSKLLCRSWLEWWFSMRRKDWVFFKSYLYTFHHHHQVACACCICASATRSKTTSPIWSMRQQQHNLHMSTTMKHASAHVQVTCCCCIPL